MVRTSRPATNPAVRRAGGLFAPVALVLAALLAVLPVAAGAGGSAGASGPLTWTLSKAFRVPPDNFQTISCPSAELCVAGGAVPSTKFVGTGFASTSAIFRTTDGGATWTGVTPKVIKKKVGSVFAVSCASTTFCAATDGTRLLLSTDGGRNWVVDASFASLAIDSADAVSCSSASTCDVAGEKLGSSVEPFVARTTDGGSTWQLQSVPSPSGQAIDHFAGLACPTTSTCEALAIDESPTFSVARTTDGGATWTSSVVPGSHGSTGTGISCPTTASCQVVANILSPTPSGETYTTHDGGATWSGPVAVTSGSLNAVACLPGGSACEAVGAGSVNAVAYGTTDGGATWKAQNFPSDTATTLEAISCPSAAVCDAAGARQRINQAVVLSYLPHEPRHNWQSLAGPSGPDGFGTVACTSATTCLVMGYDNADDQASVLRTTDGAQTWAKVPVPASFESGASVSCPTASVCFALGQDEVNGGRVEVVRSTDGGASWHLATNPPSIASLLPFVDLSCGSPTTCEIFGESASSHEVFAATTDGGTTWTTQAGPPAFVVGISCASATVCEAAAQASGGQMYGTNDGGTTWSLQTTRKGFVPKGVSCVSVSTCDVVGSNVSGQAGQGLATTDGGSSWVSQSIPLPTPAAVSCTSSASCQAVGAGTNQIGQAAGSTDGTTWQAETFPKAYDPMAVSCGTPTFCVAVDDLTHILVARP